MLNYQLVKCIHCNTAYAVEFHISRKIGLNDKQKSDFASEASFFGTAFCICFVSIANLYAEPEWLTRVSSFETYRLLLTGLLSTALVLCIPAFLVRFVGIIKKISDIEVLDKQKEILRHPNFND